MSNPNLAPISPPPSASPYRRRGRGPEGKRASGARVIALFLFLGGIVLLLFGIGSLGASFFMRGDAPPDGFAWQAPLELVNNRELTPATVLLPLTGMSAGDALNAALDGGHWENAYALLAYDSTLSAPARIGALLQLGSRYAAARNNKAAWCYLMAARVATISPLISDAVREDTFIQASAGLRSVGAMSAARLMADQSYLVAQYSPALLQEPQSRRLALVANAYSALGADALAERAQKSAADPTTVSTETAGYLARENFVIKVGALPASADLNAAIQTRIAAAQQLSDDVSEIAADRAAAWPQDALGQLTDALVQEDSVRSAYYDRQLQQAKEPSVQIALLGDKVSWMGIKYRIARGAFGASLVPEWSKSASAIRDEWSSAWSELFNLYVAQAEAIPNAQAVSQAMEDVKRQELLAQRWGWYRASAQDLHGELSDLTQQLSDASVPSLRLDALTINGKTVDFLVPDELYGKNEQALPR